MADKDIAASNTVKMLNRVLPSIVVLFAAASTASAQTAGQVITFQIDAINQIGFAGSPSLVINAASAGSNPNSVTAGATCQSVLT